FKDAIMAHAVYYPVVEILSSIAVASVIWFGGQEVLRHTMVGKVAFGFLSGSRSPLHLVPQLTTLGVLVAFIQYAQRFFRPIQDFSEKYATLQSAMAAAERIFKLLDTPAEIQEAPITKKAAGSGRIEFDHVWFAYRTVPSNGSADKSVRGTQSGEPDWVLRDVSFTIEPGETVAIVGHTGAGKTTLISLLLRFYDVQRGAIRIDGVDIKDMSLSDLRRRF